MPSLHSSYGQVTSEVDEVVMPSRSCDKCLCQELEKSLEQGDAWRKLFTLSQPNYSNYCMATVAA